MNKRFDKPRIDARPTLVDERRRRWLKAAAAVGGLSALGPLAAADPREGLAADSVFGDGFEVRNFIDFTTATLEDPLSMGGQWTNNTQGTGGNGPPGDLASMRVALARDGVTRIAQHALAPVVDQYNDSFAYLPGIGTGNLRATAVVYRDPTYNPSTNHEIELILGCRSAIGTHRWIECLWSAQGATDIASLDGSQSDFTIIGNSVFAIGPPEDGDVWVAEVVPATNTARWFVNGTLVCTATHAVITNLGTGVGIAAFMRQGDTHPGGMGFRSLQCEVF